MLSVFTALLSPVLTDRCSSCKVDSLLWDGADTCEKEARSSRTLSISVWQLLAALGRSLSTTTCRNAARNWCGSGLSPCLCLLRITENIFSKQSWLSRLVSKNLKSWFALKSAQSKSRLLIEIFHPFKHGNFWPLVNCTTTLALNGMAQFLAAFEWNTVERVCLV